MDTSDNDVVSGDKISPSWRGALHGPSETVVPKTLTKREISKCVSEACEVLRKTNDYCLALRVMQTRPDPKKKWPESDDLSRLWDRLYWAAEVQKGNNWGEVILGQRSSVDETIASRWNNLVRAWRSQISHDATEAAEGRFFTWRKSVLDEQTRTSGGSEKLLAEVVDRLCWGAPAALTLARLYALGLEASPSVMEIPWEADDRLPGSCLLASLYFLRATETSFAAVLQERGILHERPCIRHLHPTPGPVIAEWVKEGIVTQESSGRKGLLFAETIQAAFRTDFQWNRCPGNAESCQKCASKSSEHWLADIPKAIAKGVSGHFPIPDIHELAEGRLSNRKESLITKAFQGLKEEERRQANRAFWALNNIRNRSILGHGFLDFRYEEFLFVRGMAQCCCSGVYQAAIHRVETLLPDRQEELPNFETCVEVIRTIFKDAREGLENVASQFSRPVSAATPRIRSRKK